MSNESNASHVEMTDSELNVELGLDNARSTTGLTGELDRAQLEVKLHITKSGVKLYTQFRQFC